MNRKEKRSEFWINFILAALATIGMMIVLWAISHAPVKAGTLVETIKGDELYGYVLDNIKQSGHSI